MSRSKLFNMIKSRGEKPVGRNPFDLTNRHVYSQKAAKITPIKALHTYPDDYFEVTVEDFSQNKVPMNHYSFLTGKKELLAYFVPYNTIWHNFNQFQATREDPESTLLYDKGISFEPRLRLYDLYRSALYFASLYVLFTEGRALHGLCSTTPPTSASALTVKQYLDNLKVNLPSTTFATDRYEKFLETAFADMKTKLFTDGIPFGILMSFYEYAHGGRSEDLTLFETCTNLHQNYIWCDFIQKLDMLGYGNIYPIIDKFVRDFKERLYAVIYDSDYAFFYKETGSGTPYVTCRFNGTDYELIDIDFFDSDNFNSRYFDLIFGDIFESANNKLISMSMNSEQDYVFVNAYSLYAYNKCFYDYMRNVYYDTDYSPYNYNCDFINGNSLEGSIIGQEFIPMRWYWLECHQWKKDMFTGVLPDNQLGQVSELILKVQNGDGTSSPAGLVVGDPQYYAYGGSAPEKGVTQVHGFKSTSDLNGEYLGAVQVFSEGDELRSHLYNPHDDNTLSVRLETDHTHSVYYNNGTPNYTALNVLALKRAEAIQQYRQDLMRAGNRTQDIFQQVYGSTPKSELDESPYFIEVASQDINVNPIIATSQTGEGQNQSLGDIAARCTISGQNLNFKFSTKDFGVVLIMSYIIPDAFYNSYRLDPFNSHLDQESHGLPYFQNLGLQPVIGEFLNNMKDKNGRSRTLGFAPPYIEFKTDVDLVHGDFVDAYMPPMENEEQDLDYQGEMSHWVVARTDMQQEQTVSLRNFYIDPRILDNIFSFSAGSDYSTDHFFSYCSIKVNAVRAFSELGLPRF